MLADKLKEASIPKGSIALYFLGNSGFMIKTYSGKVILIDAYLSDCCEKEYGNSPEAVNNFKRLYESPIKAEQIEADLILVTHEHYDHFDIYSIPVMMKNKNTKLAGPETVLKECLKLGIDKSNLITLSTGNKLKFEDFYIIPVLADHGSLSPDAIGIIVDFVDFKIYFTGDTSYNKDKLRAAIDLKPDLIVSPINGKYGNLSSKEAALLARDCQSKVAVSCHFWTFVEHNGDPYKFLIDLSKYAKDCLCKILAVGEEFIYKGI